MLMFIIHKLYMIVNYFIKIINNHYIMIYKKLMMLVSNDNLDELL